MYCLSRKKVEETAAFLATQGIAALPYHAGLDAAARSGNQRRFLREDGVVMVATIAFGMGIDKPDVRFVAHMDLPKSLEGLLPGNRPRRPRRRARRRLAGLWPGRHGARCKQMIEQLRRRRGTPAAGAPQARHLARLLRIHALPPPGPARELRRGVCRSLRQLRQLPATRRRPGTRRWRRRKRCPACTAPASASAWCTWSTCCAASTTNA